MFISYFFRLIRHWNSKKKGFSYYWIIQLLNAALVDSHMKWIRYYFLICNEKYCHANWKILVWNISREFHALTVSNFLAGEICYSLKNWPSLWQLLLSFWLLRLTNKIQFFLSEFSFTNIHVSQDSRGRGIVSI